MQAKSVALAVGIAVAGICATPSLAVPLGSAASVSGIADPSVEHAAAVRRGAVVRGPRGGVAAGRTTAVRPPVAGAARPVVVAPAWRRPANYWWRPGTAVAVGAAVGFATAATAAAWAGPPPSPDYCWYYTDAAKTKGFWDECPP